LPTPPIPCTAARSNHSLGDRRRFVAAHQDFIEPVEFGRTPGETGDARRRADKRPRGRALRQRLPFGRGDDAPPPLPRVVDADEVLVDIAGEEAERRHVLAAQDDHPALLDALQPVGLEAGEFLAGIGRIFVVAGEQHDEVARVLDRLVHRLNEIAAERKVVILYDDLITALD
jgi:hypothetical protein